MRTLPVLLAAVLAASASAAADSHPGYVDGSAFRAVIDEDREIVEINLQGAMLQAVANSKDDDDPDGTPARELFGKLKAIHAVIGTVKGPGASALALVQQTDQKLMSSGWQRVTRIKDETAMISVLIHTTADQIDGLVALIFDAEDKTLVFANLAGPIDLNRLGEIGDRLDVPGLEHVPGAN